VVEMPGNVTQTSSAQRGEEDKKQINVCIRGFCGLLGSRLVLALQRNPDLKFAVGIAKDDPTLREWIKTTKPLSESIIKRLIPEKIYLDDTHKVVRKVNSQQPFATFESADQLNLSKSCDVIIDCASPGSCDKWLEQYSQSGLYVILQSGESPRGRLIVPPLMSKEKTDGKILRQGDCVLSGVIPVLAHLAPLSESITMHMLTQYTKKLNNYTTDERLGSTYVRNDVAEQLENEFSHLFPDTELELLGVSQVSGLSFYTATIGFSTKYPISGMEIKEILEPKPRIRVVPNVTSTYEIAHYIEGRMRALGIEVQPITVFGSDLNSSSNAKKFRIWIAISYRYIAVLPNIDAIRMVIHGLSGEDAMRITDKNMGFIV
jgi:hypothetical protein